MANVVVLQSSFESSYSKRGAERLSFVMGEPMMAFVVAALQKADFSCTEGRTADTVYITSAVPTIAPYMLEEMKNTEQTEFYTIFGDLFAFRRKDSEMDSAGQEETFEEAAERAHAALKRLPEETIAKKTGESCDFDLILVSDFITLQAAQQELQWNICQEWMKKGVRIDHPDFTYIERMVSIGSGTWIQGYARLEGKTLIGENCTITNGSRIVDSVISDGVEIKSSLIESSVMERNSNIGPYSHLRPNAHLGEGVHIGNFVEVKNATLGTETKAGHLAYIGDADVGENVNIGCGAIFVNYDGKRKHRSTVGNHAFIGSNANLVAPVVVQEEGYVAAGSTITHQVGQGDLAIERAEQRNVSGYVEKKKKKGEL